MMDTGDLIKLALAATAGFGLGGIYFGGLWWTVRRMPGTRNPLGLYFSSLAIRLAILLTAFFVLMNTVDWWLSLAALAGVIVARLLLIRRVGRTIEASEGSLASRKAL